jgi:ABC-type molybdate transport system permease subunit
MDDLVLTGAAGIIGLFLAAFVLLYGAYSITGLMYAAFVSGEYGVVLMIAGAILIAGSLYMATGIWLRKTDRI